jgi:hypothetical protein
MTDNNTSTSTHSLSLSLWALEVIDKKEKYHCTALIGKYGEEGEGEMT